MRTILVVDDEPAIIEHCVRSFESLGYGVKTASTAEEAFLLARTCDLVLTDLSLGGATGLDLIRWIRKAGNAIPIIAVSGYRGLSQQALALGAGRALDKPWDLDELVTTIEVLLGT